MNPLPSIHASQITPQRTELSLALSLLAMHGAPPHLDLWHSIDYVASAKNREISRLKAEIRVMNERYRQ